MTLQLADNLWELKLNATLDANVSQHLIGEFTASFIVVNITSDDVLDAWRQAGSVGQAISFEDSLAYGEVKNLILDTFILLQFPLLTGDNYQLYYFPLPRLVNAKIKVWEYTGETINTATNNLIESFNANATLQIKEESITEIITALETSNNLNLDLSKLEQAIKNINFFSSNENKDDNKQYLNPVFDDLFF